MAAQKRERNAALEALKAAHLHLEEARSYLLDRLARKFPRKSLLVDGILWRLQRDGTGFERIETGGVSRPDRRVGSHEGGEES